MTGASRYQLFRCHGGKQKSYLWENRLDVHVPNGGSNRRPYARRPLAPRPNAHGCLKVSFPCPPPNMRHNDSREGVAGVIGVHFRCQDGLKVRNCCLATCI
jgi:hypothetical protein